MGPQDNSKLRESLGRKLTITKRKITPSRLSVDMPEKLREDDDAQEDVAAPKQGQYMHQSIFSMITAAGSKADFQSRFDEPSSESEGDNTEEHEHMSQTVPAPASFQESTPSDSTTTSKGSKHRREPSKNPLIRSMHKLRLKPIRERKSSSAGDDMMSSSQILTPRPPASVGDDDDDDADQTMEAPFFSRILQAEAEMQMSMHEEPLSEQEEDTESPTHKVGPVSLAQKLKEIFGFEEPEQVIGEYPCWLLQNVLVQGFMYVTQKHICFYAYLPKKATTVAYSGYLSKRGQRSSQHNRYWFELKGDVLSYFDDPSKKYFPKGQVDLRLGISASIDDKDKHKDHTHFTLATDKRDYHFKADTATSARDWVKMLQKVIFRAHNDGDSVKISLPIENIMDIEDNQILDFAETVKIRVIDNDETYAIDEYFFSFFNFGQEAIRVLRIMIEDNTLHKSTDSEAPTDSEANDSDAPDSARPSLTVERPSAVPARTPPLRDSVRATLAPQPVVPRALSSSRLSNDSRRSSLDIRPSLDIRRRSYDSRASSDGRRSVSLSRRPDRSPISPQRQTSMGSPTMMSMGDMDTESSIAIQSLDETNASASQILNRSDVFQAPTLHPPQRSVSENVDDRLHRASQETARSAKQLPRSSTDRSRNRLQKTRPEPAPLQTAAVVSEQDVARMGGSGYSFQNLIKVGTSPLQTASGIAGFLKSRSKRMSTLLASESMGYYEKVSGMWAGRPKHYGSVEGMPPDDDLLDDNDEKRDAIHVQRFREHFALHESEQLVATWYCFLHRVLPLYGKIYLGSKHLCYRPLIPGVRFKLKVPLKDVETVNKEKGYRLGYSGMVVTIRGHEEIFFDFSDQGVRDDCNVTVYVSIEAHKKDLKESGILTIEESEAAELAKAEHKALQEARKGEHTEHDVELPKHLNYIASEARPILFDDPRAEIINFKPTQSLRITCLTIGTRGDVQPYIALCKGLMKEGHKCRIATHDEYGPWIKSHGIDFAPVEGDPAKLMQICVEHGMFTFSFMREATTHFRTWLDELMITAWKGCQDSDLLIESPSAMVGIHIAEALEIPYFRAFGMPWTRTRAYPHAFAVPGNKLGGNYNYVSYVMFENFFWKAIANQINRWRKKTLGLGSTSLGKMQPNKIPFLYNFSQYVVPPPLDYSDWIRITGYWFLDEDKEWTPPPQFDELKAFIKKARDDNKKIVYVGFGSVIVANPRAMTETIVKGVQKADVRCILSKGWSDRLDDPDKSVPEVPLPSEILQITYAVPHSWLFSQIDAAVHHGGAGTTGASLRAGLPTVIKPFFGDQHFYGGRVADLEVGVHLPTLTETGFPKALWTATHDERIIKRAKELGERIRAEDGVANAIQAIYRDLEYAKSLIKSRTKEVKEGAAGEMMGREDEDFEETWTFIGDESDPDLQRAIAEWTPSGAGAVEYQGLGHQARGLGIEHVKGKERT